MLDDLVKLVELSLLILVELLHDELLGIDAIIHLLFKLLNRRLHPMPIVVRRVYLLLLELLLDVAPDLAHLEVRVHLDHLELLLLVGIQVVAGEAYPVENGEYYQSDVVLLDLFADSVDQVGLCACFGEVLQEGRLRKVLLGQLRHQRLELIDHNTLLILHSVLLVLFAVELDHQLGGVYHGLLAVPLQELLDGLGVFGEIGEAGEGHLAVHVITGFDELQKVKESLCAEEALFGSSASQHCVPEGIQKRKPQ